jgi:hypothetical protein
MYLHLNPFRRLCEWEDRYRHLLASAIYEGWVAADSTADGVAQQG